MHLLWARSGPGRGESGASREDSRFMDFVTLPFPASLLVLFRGRPYHTEESSHLLLFKKKKIYFSFGGAGSLVLHTGFLSCDEQRPLLVVVRGLLVAVGPVVPEPGLQGVRAR